MASAPLVLLGLLGQLLLPCWGLGMTLVQRRADWFWRKPSLDAPADACLTAREGDRCHKAVKYAVEKGYFRHPHWYPEYNSTGSTDLDMLGMQMVMHKLKKAGCAMPCPVEQYIEAEVHEEVQEVITTTTALAPMNESKLEDISLDDFSKYLKRPEELDAYVRKIGGQVSDPTDGDNGHSKDPGHATDGGEGSTDGSRGKTPSTDAVQEDPRRHQLQALGAERRKAERLVQAQKDDYDQVLADSPPAWSPRSAAVENRLKALSAHRQQAEKRMQQLEGRMDELVTAAGIDPAEAVKIEAQR